jgi:HlyD family secretion protein
VGGFGIASHPRPNARRNDGIRGNLLLGGLITLALVGGVGGWVATTSIAGAVIAGGTVMVESNVKKVQHQTGGIVGDILVRNGDHVKAGDVVIQLDETQTRANMQIVSQQLDRVRIRMARLEAEAFGSPIMLVPAALQDRAANPDIDALISGERALFDSNKRSLDGKSAQLIARNGQYGEQKEGLKAQRQAAEESLALVQRDLVTVEDLYKRKLIPLERLSSLQLEVARQKGEIGRLTAAIAEVEGRISENDLLSIQIKDDSRQRANSDLRDAEAKEAELIERLQVAQDLLTRTVIRAPQTGVVQELSVHTIGGVVTPGEELMLIVPESDALVVDAQIAPQHIDDVDPGQPVVIRFSAFDRNTTPECHGSVDRVSPDLIRNEAQRTAYYVARISIKDRAECLDDSKHLVPGMPAELHIQTGDRTVWSYIMKPLLDQLSRSLRE